MNEKKGFILYKNFENQFRLLTLEQRGELITAVFEYARAGEICGELTPLVAMAFTIIKDSLDRDQEAYTQRCEQNARNGRLGGRPRKSYVGDSFEGMANTDAEYEKKTERFFEKPKKADKDIDKDKDIDIDIDIDKDKEQNKNNEKYSTRNRGIKRPANAYRSEQPSFDLDAFFEAACRRTFEED